MALPVLAVLAPLNLLLWRRSEEVGALPDGASHAPAAVGLAGDADVVDPSWASIEWTLARALCTARFWWLVRGYFCAFSPGIPCRCTKQSS